MNVFGTKLTQRQYDVMRLVCEGYSTVEIAKRLGIERFTVLNHLKLVYAKLGVNSRERVILAAQRLGIVRIIWSEQHVVKFEKGHYRVITAGSKVPPSAPKTPSASA